MMDQYKPECHRRRSVHRWREGGAATGPTNHGSCGLHRHNALLSYFGRCTSGYGVGSMHKHKWALTSDFSQLSSLDNTL